MKRMSHIDILDQLAKVGSKVKDLKISLSGQNTTPRHINHRSLSRKKSLKSLNSGGIGKSRLS
jgi:hypothetical protein